MAGEKGEKIPLRHERDEFASAAQAREIAHAENPGAEVGGAFGHSLMRELKELIEQAKLVHDLEGGGMDGVAAEIAEEVFVLLEHEDIDPRAGQQEAEHDARRPPADDAA